MWTALRQQYKSQEIRVLIVLNILGIIRGTAPAPQQGQCYHCGGVAEVTVNGNLGVQRHQQRASEERVDYPIQVDGLGSSNPCN